MGIAHYKKPISTVTSRLNQIIVPMASLGKTRPTRTVLKPSASYSANSRPIRPIRRASYNLIGLGHLSNSPNFQRKIGGVKGDPSSDRPSNGGVTPETLHIKHEKFLVLYSMIID
jgi:hypothetical protein